MLDEVEAALDEGNVMRYGEYVNELCDERELIVIREGKGRMEF